MGWMLRAMDGPGLKNLGPCHLYVKYFINSGSGPGLDWVNGKELHSFCQGKLYVVYFFDFIWTWILNFLNLLDYVWTWTEFEKFRTGSWLENMTVRSSLVGWRFGKIMTSFDVTSLFTDVRVDFTINLILDSVLCRSDEFNGLNRRRMKKQLEWVVKTTTFQFNGCFYWQVDDVAMGPPIAPLMADVCMNYVIDQALAVPPAECRPDLFCHYVDDLLLLFPNQDSLNRFFTNINSIHRNIVFTKELETNNCLHFLDVLIEKTSTGFINSTYRKPTHTGLYSYGRVLFHCTGNETLYTLYSTSL